MVRSICNLRVFKNKVFTFDEWHAEFVELIFENPFVQNIPQSLLTLT